MQDLRTFENNSHKQPNKSEVVMAQFQHVEPFLVLCQARLEERRRLAEEEEVGQVSLVNFRRPIGASKLKRRVNHLQPASASCSSDHAEKLALQFNCKWSGLKLHQIYIFDHFCISPCFYVFCFLLQLPWPQWGSGLRRLNKDWRVPAGRFYRHLQHFFASRGSSLAFLEPSWKRKNQQIVDGGLSSFSSDSSQDERKDFWALDAILVPDLAMASANPRRAVHVQALCRQRCSDSFRVKHPNHPNLNFRYVTFTLTSPYLTQFLSRKWADQRLAMAPRCSMPLLPALRWQGVGMSCVWAPSQTILWCFEFCSSLQVPAVSTANVWDCGAGVPSACETDKLEDPDGQNVQFDIESNCAIFVHYVHFSRSLGTCNSATRLKNAGPSLDLGVLTELRCAVVSDWPSALAMTSSDWAATRIRKQLAQLPMYW